MSTHTTRLGLVIGIRVVAAFVVVGSAVTVTALSVRQHDQVASVVVNQAATGKDAAGKAAAPVPGAPPVSGPRGNAAPPAGAAALPGAGAVPLGGAAAAAPSVGLSKPGTSPNGAAPGVGAATPLGTSANSGAPGSNPAVPGANPAVPGASPEVPGTNTVPLGASPFTAPALNTQPRCPLGWPAPAQQGGLASLIGLAPMAGPFSSEAFALGAVYQPLLQLAGPVLAQIAPVLAQYQPAIDPVITRVQGAEAVVLQAILPYYGPYRGQLIAAEGDLARRLTPVLDSVYNSPAASCFVAWQGQVIAQAKGGPIKVASLAHPGTVVELGPKP